MALAKTLTRMWPTENEIGINLVLTDDDRPDLGAGAQVVVSKTFKADVPIDIDMTNDVQQDLGERAQRAINSYKALKVIYDKPVYQTKVNQINNNLTL